MSKLDAQRAMKEAKYAREMAAAETRRKAAGKTAATPVAPASSTEASSAAKQTPSKAAADSGTGTCGHRSMNGRTCTREAGHSEKSHRYS